jgi:hypothetical protein
VSFALFCRKATDNQLANIIQKEAGSSRKGDQETAENEARTRGWSDEEIKTARSSGS